MEKGQFLSLIKNFTSLETNELTALINAQSIYPYSQIIHNLASRAASDNDAISKDELLHLSAIYTTDRLVLKSVMTAPKIERKENISFGVFRENEPPYMVSVKPDFEAPTKHLNSELIIDTLFADLENLKKSKLFYEASMDALEKENQLIQTLKLNDHPDSKIEPPINEDALVTEMTSFKEEVIITDNKQKEQIEIIEKFINTQPGINKPKPDGELNQTDLSDKSQHFADNVISETLVEILLKQGKKAKAVEVLKKLIWKFPQKKAYFAAQIEDLKK